MRTRIPLLLVAASAMLMSGCDQNKSVTVKDKDGDVTISANGQQFHVHANDGKQSDVTVSGSGGNVTVHSTDGNATVEVNAAGVNVGGKLPGFVNIYPGAKVVSTVNGGSTGNGGGTVAFETGAAPADVIGFYKQKASGAGFTQNSRRQRCRFPALLGELREQEHSGAGVERQQRHPRAGDVERELVRTNKSNGSLALAMRGNYR